MKKAILMMAALVAVTFSAQAQKKSKEEQAAEKAKKEMMTVAMIDRIVPAKNFQFIPREYMLAQSGTTMINRYEYTRVRPNSLEVSMTNCQSVNTNRYEWVSCEKVKDKYNVKMKAVSDKGANLDFDFVIDAKKGTAQLKVRSNKALVGGAGGANSITYKGEIREY
ncbi:MAG: hypothetical protein J1E79_07710 [Rikenella sp.]|nr:hypothetical protein [Rikenella sp.]